MKIYLLEPNLDKYQGLVPVDDDFWDSKSLMFNGVGQLTDEWEELNVEVPEGDESLPIGDFPDFSVPYIPVFSSNAKKEISELVGRCGEFLASQCDGKIYYLFNVTTLLNNLDEKKSDLERLASNGRIIKVRKAIFNEGTHFPPIFKLENMPFGNVFVSQEFKDLVESNNLKGFKFIVQNTEE